MSDRFIRTIHFIDTVERTKTAADVEDCLLALAGKFGFTGVFGGILPTRPMPLNEISSRVLFQRYPAEWTARYNARGYIFLDPVVERLSSARNPFTWHESYETGTQKQNVELIRGEASEFGLRDGYVVPVSTIDGEIAALSFGGEGGIPDSADLSVLNFAASYVVGRHLHRLATRNPRPDLTPREWDCLLWAGEGKTDWEISVILGISRSTVIKHVTSAREKLGAANRAHAIAMAIRKNFIR